MSGTVTYEEAVNRVIKRRFAPLKHAAKLLARASGASPRTAENWLAGSHAPSGESLLNLMAACPELADEMNRVVAERRAALRARSIENLAKAERILGGRE
jgi:hypothetical protein